EATETQRHRDKKRKTKRLGDKGTSRKMLFSLSSLYSCLCVSVAKPSVGFELTRLAGESGFAQPPTPFRSLGADQAELLYGMLFDVGHRLVSGVGDHE